MQAEGDVIRFPERASIPMDFAAFFAEDLWTAWTFADLVPEELRPLL